MASGRRNIFDRYVGGGATYVMFDSLNDTRLNDISIDRVQFNGGAAISMTRPFASPATAR